MVYSDSASQGRLQGVRGVVKHGNDPRRLVRRIAQSELGSAPPAGAKQVVRGVSGRSAPGETKPEKSVYWEIPIDLVEAGEKLCPGSASWENAYLWRLAYPALPSLEDIRSKIAELKARLELCSPSLDEYRGLLPEAKFAALSRLSHAQLVKRYVLSLKPLAKHPTADSLSLLAALVAECYVTDQEVLLQLHRDAFHKAVEILLLHPLMADIAAPFRDWISLPVLTGAWQFPAVYHVSSLMEPFIPFEAWAKMLHKSGHIGLQSCCSPPIDQHRLK
ncbi:hypothetical protein IP93_03015 [Lysobacter ruishenii]|uniref:Uncharacterized protein n=2 Tax=Aerolutibacter ruishenii TaxID=686800 RepID=A0A562LDT4_9GAMM|nr:hypothetical protein IP93_03015 [Lysobacter ruishenii]